MEVATTRIFVDFSKEQQATELAAYISLLKSENVADGEFVSSVKQLVDSQDLKGAIQKILSAAPLILQSAPERELEGEFNLIISLLRSVDAADLSSFVEQFVAAFATVEGGKPALLIKILSNLYNNLDVNSPIRLIVYSSIIKLAARTNRLALLLPHLNHIQGWAKQWGVTLEQKRQLYLLLHTVFVAANLRLEAHKALVYLLDTFESGDGPDSKQHATVAIVEAISIPSLFQFDDLLKLKAVQQLKDEKIFQLLEVLVNGDLSAFETFFTANSQHLSELGLKYEANKEKMRLISLASLCSKHIGSEVSFTVLAKAINVPVEEVERWLIDAIRFHLIDAKMDQLKQTLIVNGTTYRVFDTAHWQDLAKRLTAWRASVSSALQVVQNAKLIAQSQTA